ncbi:MAG: DNA polymerase I, partial [Sphingomonadales bacterium]|nr:DNA polymerase I [Sphingomonadales bacterium]
MNDAAPPATPHLYLVDGSSYIFRAFHALPMLTKSDGTPVNAVLGFCNMLFKLLQDLAEGEQPTHFAVIFDAGAKTFRNDIYPDYKANRPPPPEELIPQFGLVREATEAFSVPAIEMEGFEADDLIATYAEQARTKGWQVTIVSSDKDLMQLVDEQVGMFDTMKNRRIGIPEVHEKFGVGPERVVDVQSLAGDSTDNVPGVPGIGIKTAAELINTYGDLDTLLDHAEEIKQPKRRENLIENAEMARISRELVTLDRASPVPAELDALKLNHMAPEPVLGFVGEMEFRSLKTKLLAHLGVEDAAEDAAAAELAVKEVAYDCVTDVK